MNNFYDDVFDMVPVERPNRAVEQLAVNESGDVTVDGALSVKGVLSSTDGIHATNNVVITSGLGTSHIFMHATGNPSGAVFDSDIYTEGGVAGKPNQGKLTLNAGSGIVMYTPNGNTQFLGQSVDLRTNVNVSCPGTSSTIGMYGSVNIVEPPGVAVPPAVRLVSTGGNTTITDQGNLDIYATTCTHHGDVVIDPTKGNLFIPVTSAVGPDIALLKIFTDVGAPKLGFRWGGKWWWFTSTSNSAA